MKHLLTDNTPRCFTFPQTKSAHNTGLLQISHTRMLVFSLTFATYRHRLAIKSTQPFIHTRAGKSSTSMSAFYSWAIVHSCWLDQELISYRYPSCSCCWGDVFKNGIVSNRIGMKFSSNAFQANTCRFDARFSRWRPWRHFMQKSAATWWMNIKRIPLTAASATYSVPPELIAAFKGPTSKGREERRGEGERWKGRKSKGEGRWVGGRDLAHPEILAWYPLGPRKP